MPFTHGHALIIGIGSYQHEPGLNVPITAADAQAVATVLRDPQYCGYPEAQVTLLSNASATRAGILAALTDLATRTKPDDTVLLFYSGHGEYSADGVYQLTTHDTRLVQRKVVAGTGISQPELLDKLRAIPAKRLILLINACHAGELSPVLGDSDQPFTGQPLPQQAADAVLATGSGRIIMTACRENQVSYIGPGQITIFAQALTDGLRGQGLSGRAGYISAFDLYTHLSFAVGEAVERRVSAALRQRYGNIQEPELTVLKGVGPFAMALYRGSTTLGDFPTDHMPPDDTALREVSQARSRWAFQQSISGAGAVGIGRSVSNSPITTGSNNTVIQSGRDTIRADGDVNQIAGDYVARDKITHHYQPILRPLPVNLRSLVQPLIKHYTAIFGGRDAELAQLDAFLADPQHPFGLLVAPTGLGKTALLVHWIARVQQQHPQWRIIFAPVSIRYQTASAQVMLSILAHSLAEIHNDLEQFRSYDQSPTSLRALITAYLHRPLPDGIRLLLVLDGIDEATGWEVGPLCAVPPQAGLKIVVAARQRANATRDNYQQDLGWTHVPVAHLDLQALDLPAVAALLRQSAPTLAADPAFVKQFYRVSEGDPLTSNLLIKALWSGQLAPHELTQRPPGLDAFLRDWIESLRQRRQASRPIRELLALCAAAYGPLSSDDLHALAPEVFGEQTDIVDAVRDDEVARFIITVGDHTYVFSHQRLREVFLEQIYPPKDRGHLHQRLIAYGNAWYADRSQPLPDYLRQFWIAHLKTDGSWERIRQVLTEIVPVGDGSRYIQPWQAARSAAEGSDTGYLSDLDLLWGWADDQGDLGLALRCALIAASLRSRSGNLTPDLLVQLVQVGTPEGKWSAAAALEHVAQILDAERQVNCLRALLHTDVVLPWPRTLEIVRNITTEGKRSEALQALVPRLPMILVPNAFDAVLDICDEAWCVQVLAALAPRLDPQLLPRSLEVVQGFEDERWRAEALSALAPYLAHLLPSALDLAQSFVDKWYQSQVFGALAPHLPVAQQEAVWQQALDAACAITDEGKRTRSLIDLAPHLSAAQQGVVWQQVLDAALAMEEEQRVRILEALAPNIGATQPEALWEQVFTVVERITDDYRRMKALSALAPHLPTMLLSMALDTALGISVEAWRVDALVVLASRMPPHLLLVALEAAQGLLDERSRTYGLIGLTPYLSVAEQEVVWPQALDAALTITDKQHRAWALGTLAPHLPAEQQEAIWQQALDAVLAISNGWDRGRMLGALTAYMPEHLLPTALDMTRSFVADAVACSTALELLIPHLPAHLLSAALDVAQTITVEQERTKTLGVLAPRLPAHLLGLALNAAQSIRDNEGQAHALKALAPHLPIAQQATVWQQAAITAQSIPSTLWRAHALRALAPQLPPEQQSLMWQQALVAAQAIAFPWDRAEMLGSLAPHLPAEQQGVIWPQALKATQAIRQVPWSAETLARLAAHIPEQFLPMALETALAIRHHKERAKGLVTLIPRLTEHLIELVFVSLPDIKDFEARAEVLVVLVGCAPPAQQAIVWQQALDAVLHISGEQVRAKLLIALMSQIPETQQEVVWQQVLDATLDIKDAYWRTLVLRSLALQVSESQQGIICQQALATAQMITNDVNRSWALMTLAATLRLSTAQQQEVWQQALEAAQAIPSALKRAEALWALAPYLPATQQEWVWQHALEAAQTITHKQDRAKALGALVPHLPVAQQGTVWTQALEAALSIIDEHQRFLTLSALVPQVPAELALSALHAAYTISLERDRVTVLEQLAPRLAAHIAPSTTPLIVFIAQRCRAGRPALLRDLAALMPWLVAVVTSTHQPHVLTEFASAISETAQIWP